MSLEFDEATHTYRVGGRVVPSVTQVLQLITDYSGIPAKVLENARDRGVRVHRVTELDDEGTLDQESVDPEDQPYLEAWRRFKAEFGVVVLESEKRVYSQQLGYAGTLDRVIATADRGEWLIDVKATHEIKATVGPQTAAYHRALGLGSLRRGVIQLLPTGKYNFKELNDPRDWSVFQACLIIHRFKQENQ